MQKGKFEIAICYDFDGTLSPGNMQEYSFIPRLQQSPDEFWADANKLAKEHDADVILAYMYLMCERAKKAGIKIRRKDFENFGSGVKFFPGILPDELTGKDWFLRIKNFAAPLGAKVRHYVISSGIKEMIEGTAIADNFHRVYASSFMYDVGGSAMWPALAVNYTTKMQYLFRINKGALDIQKTVNNFMPENERPVPFKRMIFIGDGLTDIPAMKLVKTQGGYAIAVHDGTKRKAKINERLLAENRVNFVTKADYQEASQLDCEVRRVISQICKEANAPA